MVLNIVTEKIKGVIINDELISTIIKVTGQDNFSSVYFPLLKERINEKENFSIKEIDIYSDKFFSKIEHQIVCKDEDCSNLVWELKK